MDVLISTLGCVILVPFDQQHLNCVGDTRGDCTCVALTLKKNEGPKVLIIRWNAAAMAALIDVSSSYTFEYTYERKWYGHKRNWNKKKLLIEEKLEQQAVENHAGLLLIKAKWESSFFLCFVQTKSSAMKDLAPFEACK
jgi:hypothetical protein